jgi:hypothetical protein
MFYNKQILGYEVVEKDILFFNNYLINGIFII